MAKVGKTMSGLTSTRTGSMPPARTATVASGKTANNPKANMGKGMKGAAC